MTVAALSLPLLMLPPKATSLLLTLPPYNCVAVNDSFVHFLILSPTVLLIVTMCNGSGNRVGNASMEVMDWLSRHLSHLGVFHTSLTDLHLHWHWNRSLSLCGATSVAKSKSHCNTTTLFCFHDDCLWRHGGCQEFPF